MLIWHTLLSPPLRRRASRQRKMPSNPAHGAAAIIVMNVCAAVPCYGYKASPPSLFCRRRPTPFSYYIRVVLISFLAGISTVRRRAKDCYDFPGPRLCLPLSPSVTFAEEVCRSRRSEDFFLCLPSRDRHRRRDTVRVHAAAAASATNRTRF